MGTDQLPMYKNSVSCNQQQTLTIILYYTTGSVGVCRLQC